MHGIYRKQVNKKGIHDKDVIAFGRAHKQSNDIRARAKESKMIDLASEEECEDTATAAKGDKNGTMPRIAAEVSNLVRCYDKPALKPRETQLAIRLMLPGELKNHAISEGAKALTSLQRLLNE